MNLARSNVNIMRFLIIDEINLNLNQHHSPFTTNAISGLSTIARQSVAVTTPMVMITLNSGPDQIMMMLFK